VVAPRARSLRGPDADDHAADLRVQADGARNDRGPLRARDLVQLGSADSRGLDLHEHLTHSNGRLSISPSVNGEASFSRIAGFEIHASVSVLEVDEVRSPPVYPKWL